MSIIHWIVSQARKSHPYWCKLKVKGGPDPRVLDTGKYGAFIRFPYDGETNCWCFETEEHRNKFIKDYKAIAFE